MKIEVYVKDNVYTINCGNGAQRIKWLAQVAALKNDGNGMMLTGQPKGMKLQDGTMLGMNERINERLFDSVRVWVVFEDTQAGDKKKQVKGRK